MPEPQLKTNFSELIAHHLEPINFNRWAEPEYKDELTEDGKKEKNALEEKNIATIEKVYQRLRDDKEIQAQIEKIKAHPWVRVVEGD